MSKYLTLTDNTVETIESACYEGGTGLVKYDKDRFTEVVILLDDKASLAFADFIYENVKRERK